MNIVVDTNVLIRTVVRDDSMQAEAADKVLRGASLIAVTLPCLCEFVWVLLRVYRFTPVEVIAALEALLHARNVVLNRPAVDIGLAFLKAGGDFADGVIAFEGKWMGGDDFVSFDKKAISMATTQGYTARLLK